MRPAPRSGGIQDSEDKGHCRVVSFSAATRFVGASGADAHVDLPPICREGDAVRPQRRARCLAPLRGAPPVIENDMTLAQSRHLAVGPLRWHASLRWHAY